MRQQAPMSSGHVAPPQTLATPATGQDSAIAGTRPDVHAALHAVCSLAWIVG